MSWKVSNVRLGLDEPEAGLPRRLADDLALPEEAIRRLRILRKSLDARRHEDIHFVYAAEIELEDERPPTPRAEGVQVAPFQEPHFEWPESGVEPLPDRLAQPELVKESAAALTEEIGVLGLDSLTGEQGVDAVLERRAYPGQHDPVAEQVT